MRAKILLPISGHGVLIGFEARAVDSIRYGGKSLTNAVMVEQDGVEAKVHAPTHTERFTMWYA